MLLATFQLRSFFEQTGFDCGCANLQPFCRALARLLQEAIIQLKAGAILKPSEAQKPILTGQVSREAAKLMIRERVVPVWQFQSSNLAPTPVLDQQRSLRFSLRVWAQTPIGSLTKPTQAL